MISKIQKQFWILNKLFPDNASYNIPMVYKIDGILDVPSLNKAVNRIIARHEPLRSDFVVHRKEIEQQIYDKEICEYKIETIKKNDEYLGNELKDLMDEDINRPFKLDEWPLFRIKLIVFKNNISVLLIIFHHIIIDHVSKEIFAHELSLLYNQYIHGGDIQIKENAIQYSDYISWENGWLNSDETDKMLLFWKKTLENIDPVLELPADYERPKFLSSIGKNRYFSLGEEISNEVKRFSKDNTVNVFVILLASYAAMLHILSNQDEIVIGVPFTNRRKDKIKDIFGPFVNILPIKIDFSKQPTGIELIKQVRQALLFVHRNQEIPFLHLLEQVEHKRDYAYNPFFQVGFTFVPPVEINLGGLQSEGLLVERKGAQLDLFFSLWESDGVIHGYSEYATKLFNESTIEEWENKYRNIVDSLIQKPNISINS